MYALALSAVSPCLGAGKDGTDMGAATGRCDGPAGKARILHLAPGTYQAVDLALVHKVSLLGSGEDRTVIEGTVVGLRTGSVLSNVTVTKGAKGGIVTAEGESPEITNCTISGNWAWGESGGGVDCYASSPTLTNCTISGNTGSGVYCYYDASPTLTNCTISGNWASGGGRGGGGVCCYRASPTLTNCTISGNSASGSRGSGGGVYCSYASPTLTNCTISGNTASDDGGVYCKSSSSSPALTNCIVWGNSPDSVCGKLTHCLTDQDPLFLKNGIFDFQGWKTVTIGGDDHRLPDFIVEAPDYHLLPGSPAIDAGRSESAPTTDIEGHGRPCGNGVDVGAYEDGDCQATGTRFVRGDVDGNGKLELSDPIAILGHLFQGLSAPSCLDAADSNDDGGVNISDPIYSLSFQFLGGPRISAPFPDCGLDVSIHGLGCQTYPRCQ